MSISAHLAKRTAETACVSWETLDGSLSRLTVNAALSEDLRLRLDRFRVLLRKLCDDSRLQHTSGLMAEVDSELRALECPEVER